MACEKGFWAFFYQTAVKRGGNRKPDGSKSILPAYFLGPLDGIRSAR